MSWEKAAYSFPKGFDLIFSPYMCLDIILKTISIPTVKNLCINTKYFCNLIL